MSIPRWLSVCGDCGVEMERLRQGIYICRSCKDALLRITAKGYGAIEQTGPPDRPRTRLRQYDDIILVEPDEADSLGELLERAASAARIPVEHDDAEAMA